MQAILTNPQGPEHLVLGEVSDPHPGPSEALVRVAAVSLNRGEVRRAMSTQERYTPGWDLAGTVIEPAADGSGPKAGARVVAYLPGGAWSEAAAVSTSMLAELPDTVTFGQAATLPVAGITALLALRKTGSLLGRRVLVTGASGGVGDFAVQLAYRSGARVVGMTQHEEYAWIIREAGASEVVVGEPSGASVFGPYDLVCDGVGGAVLSTVAAMLAPGGICVTYAAAIQAEVALNVRTLMQTPSAYVTGLLVLNELRVQPASLFLKPLISLVDDGRLLPHITVEAPWNEVNEISQLLIDRKYAGKAVMLVK